MTFGSYTDRIPLEDLDIRIDTVSINTVNCIKYLEIYFDCHLRCSDHIKIILSVEPSIL